MTWWFPWYVVVAVAAVVLSLYTMQKAERDEINSLAPPWLQWARRAGFIAMSTALCASIWEYATRESLALLMTTGVYSLGINAIALYLRTPPEHGSVVGTQPNRSLVRRGLALLRNGIFRR